MNIYFAPLEGITGYIYRQMYDKYYGHGKISKYFIPFISPTQHAEFTTKEKKDILMENNENLYAVPQILCNRAEYFLQTAHMLCDMGYREVNLNVGCPSKTVVAKRKGVGMMRDMQELDEFFRQVYTDSLFAEGQMKFSVKTRIGLNSIEEAQELIAVYNQYALDELIIHPRLQNEYYKGVPHRDVFAQMLLQSKNPVCYNGDIFTMTDIEEFQRDFPEIDTVMLGRGLLANPALIDECIQNTRRELTRDDIQKMKAFHDALCAAYTKEMDGDTNVLHKMKELWFYMEKTFTGADKLYKAIRKTRTLSDYQVAVNQFFAFAPVRTAEHIYFDKK